MANERENHSYRFVMQAWDYFMIKYVFKVMDTCLWYPNSGCSWHMTGGRSFLKVFKSKKGGNVTFGNGKWTISLLGDGNIKVRNGKLMDQLQKSKECAM